MGTRWPAAGRDGEGGAGSMAPDGEQHNPIEAEHVSRTIQNHQALRANRTMPMGCSIPLRAEVLLLGRSDLSLYKEYVRLINCWIHSCWIHSFCQA
jgi:hypothetical protein